jgi:hypothetical protein
LVCDGVYVCVCALSYLKNSPDQVLDALRTGEISAIDVATEEVPDFFMLYAIESGLLDDLARTFPDPRTQQPEIPMRLLLAAGITGHFAGLYALSQLPYALHSPRLLAELGVQVVVNQPGEGLSRRGTKEQAPFHGDVIRKFLELVGKLDKEGKLMPGRSLIDWFNGYVGEIFCRAVNAEPIIHILDCTLLCVTLKNERYEMSGVTSRTEPVVGSSQPVKTYERGYKLGTLRSLLDEGAVMSAISWGQIQDNDQVLTKELVYNTPHLKPGDILLEDRGFLDATTITHLKIVRQVDVYTGLKKDMLTLRGAIAQANAHPHAWKPHPTRKNQEIQLVSGMGSLWEGLGVPVNVCVVRYKDKKTQDWQYFGFITTDLWASAKRIIETYQTRPEIEEDYRQLKSSSWHLEKFCTTRLVQILWHVMLTLVAYNLFQIYANTEKGRAFAGKTKQRIQREQRRNQEAFLLICTPQAFGVFKTKDMLYLMLGLPDDIRQKLQAVLIQKRE